MTVLVTGAAGFIGNAVVRILQQRGEQLLVLQHRWEGSASLDVALGSADIAACLHLGWYAGASDYLVNVFENRRSLNDSLDLVAALGSRGCARLVVAGTSAEYGVSPVPLVESSEVAPWSVYGAAKASFHRLLCSSLRPTGMSVSWARLFNLTGPGESPTRLLPNVATHVLAGRPIELTDGTQVRDFLHVDDVARGLITAMDVGHDGAVNVCTGEGVRLRDLLVDLAEQLGEPSLLRFGERTRAKNDPDCVVGSSTVLRQLGWRPSFDKSQTIVSVANYWRDMHQRTQPSSLK